MVKGGDERILFRGGLDLDKEMYRLLCKVITEELTVLVCGAKKEVLPMLCPLPGKPYFSVSCNVAAGTTSSDCSF